MFSKKTLRGRAWKLVPVVGAAMVMTGLTATTQANAAGFPDGHYSVSASPSTVIAGSAVDLVVTFTNDSPGSQDLMRGVSVTLPSSPGFTAVSLTSVSGAGGAWTGSASGNTVSANTTGTNLGAGPNATVTLNIHATAPTAAGTYSGWSSAATGTIGSLLTTGSYTLDGSNPSTTVVSATPTQLVFVQQPTNTKTGSPISPAITVAARDAFGNPASTFSGSVTLSTAFNPNTGNATNPSGNLPQTVAASSGVATFSNVIINQSGDNYRLSASSGSLTPATSNAFREDTVSNTCAPGAQCTSQTLSSNGTTAKVTDEVGASNDVYTLALDNPNPEQCGKSVSGNESTFTNQDLSRYLTVTMTLASSKRISGKTYSICFANKTVFTTKSGAPATLGSDGFWHGYLANCSTNGNTKPCLVSLTEDCYHNLTAVFRSPPGDPRGMFGIL